MSIFETKYQEYLKEFGDARRMVLSTSKDNIISSRMMSVIMIEGRYYFQTDLNFRKYKDITANPNVALCIDNIQIEGMAEELGKPSDNPEFSEKFRQIYPGSYKAYSDLENERLFVIEPGRIERWQYINTEAFIETFNIKTKEYNIEKYIRK